MEAEFLKMVHGWETGGRAVNKGVVGKNNASHTGRIRLCLCHPYKGIAYGVFVPGPPAFEGIMLPKRVPVSLTKSSKTISGHIQMLKGIDFNLTPSARIFLESEGISIISEEKNWKNVIFTMENGEDILFYSEPPSRRKFGLIKWLRNFHFIMEGECIAEVNFHGLSGNETFFILSYEAEIKRTLTDNSIVYRCDAFCYTWSNALSNNFIIYDEDLLWPSIALIDYLWRKGAGSS